MLTGIAVAIHVLLAMGLIAAVLAQSGKDAGLSGAFGIGQSQMGATHLMAKNLTRLTTALALLLVATTVFLGFRIG